MQQFVFDEQGLNDLLNRAFRMGIVRAVRTLEPDMWKEDGRRWALEKMFERYLGQSDSRQEPLIGSVFKFEDQSI